VVCLLALGLTDVNKMATQAKATSVQTLRRLATALETNLVVGFADDIAGLGSAGVDPRQADLIAAS
jgi:hypothetical protein